MSEHSEPPAGTAGPPAPGGLESATGAPLFSAPSFRKFTMLACGFVAQAGKRTVCAPDGRSLLSCCPIVLLPGG